MARPFRRAPCKRTSPRQTGRRGSHLNPASPGHGPNHSLQPPVRDVVLPNAEVRTPRGGLTDVVEMPAVEISTSARCTYLQVRPRRMRGLTPMVSECAWPAGKLPHKGRGARDTLLHGGTGGTGTGQHAPPAQVRSPLAGPLPAGLDLVQLLGTRIPTLRRVPIAASSTCVRPLTCLLQALERRRHGRSWPAFSYSPASPSQSPHGATGQRGPLRPSNAGSTAWRLLWTHWGN